MIGKWQLGWDFHFKSGQPSDAIGFKPDIQEIDYSKPVTNGPDSLGFDYYYGHCGSLDMAPYVYVENGKVTAAPNRVTENKDYKGFWRKGPTGADFIHEQVFPNFINRACDYIKERSKSGKPFFLYLPCRSYTNSLDGFKGKSKTNEYGDFVVQMDMHMGQILRAIKDAGVDENTMVIFTSDNGIFPCRLERACDNQSWSQYLSRSQSRYL